VGVRGKDTAAKRLEEVVREAGIEQAALVEDGSRPTTVKTRTIAHSQQVVRTDRESKADISPEVEERVLGELVDFLKQGRALVLSDYSKGVLTPRILERSIAMARRKELPILVDPKLRRFQSYRRVSLLTPNLSEAERAFGAPIEDRKDLGVAAKRILSSLRCDAVLITRGEQGMSLFEQEKRPLHIGATAREVFDVTGAGDTVIATMAMALSVGASATEAALLANYAGGLVVMKRGTATLSADELQQAVAMDLGQRG
jgi:D-beta-D-heptose 7-phosphate kinase/D-beta-D-heptose 1-phosphate adenosyltransferase